MHGREMFVVGLTLYSAKVNYGVTSSNMKLVYTGWLLHLVLRGGD